MLRKLIDKIKPTKKTVTTTTESRGNPVIPEKTFTDVEELSISNIMSVSCLDFFYINEYAQEIVKKSSMLIDDSLIESQGKVVDQATKELEKNLDYLGGIDNSNFSLLRIKEINLLSHYYQEQLSEHLKHLNSKKEIGTDLFREYDIYLEAGRRFIEQEKKKLIDSQDAFEQHFNSEKKKGIQRFEEKLFKLYNHKVYNLQGIAQMRILSDISEKLYEQLSETIYIVIPILRHSLILDNSLSQISHIRSNFERLQSEKTKSMEKENF